MSTTSLIIRRGTRSRAERSVAERIGADHELILLDDNTLSNVYQSLRYTNSTLAAGNCMYSDEKKRQKNSESDTSRERNADERNGADLSLSSRSVFSSRLSFL